MRKLLLGSAFLLSLAAMPQALNAQSSSTQNTAQANNQARVPPSTTTVVTDGVNAAVVQDNPGNLAAPPPSSMNKTYPVCRNGQTDNCQNAGEGGAPGRSRALGYWPGKPASEGGH